MTAPAQRFRFGAFTLDAAERLLLKDGRVVPITPKAFDLLAVMVRNPGRLLSKDELIKEVWPGTFIEESNLAYNVFTVRRALGEGADEDRYIETVPRRGYRFVAPIAPVDVATGEGAAEQAPIGETWPPDDRSAIQESASGTENGPPSTAPVSGPATVLARQAWPGWVVATMASIALIWLGSGPFTAKPLPAGPMRFQMPLPVRLLEASPFSISPDGRHLAYAGIGSDGIARLWVQDLEVRDPRPVSGTELKVSIAPPFWSPDSSFIGYDAGGQLMKVSVSGGAPQPVCQLGGLAVGGAWRDAVIVVGNATGGLMMCPASGGGTASPVTIPASGSGDEIHIFPSFLPDGQHLLYTRISRTAPENSGVFVGSLDPGAAGASGTRLLATGFGSAYVDGGDARTGQILFVRDGALFAQRFDARQLKPEGDAVRVASPVGSYQDFAFFSVSASGLLVFKAPDPDVQLTWFDRQQQRETGVVGEPGRYSGLALSPDGTRAVAIKHAPKSTVDQDLWLFELSRDAPPHKLTFGPLLERAPVWVSDSDRIVFSSGGGLSGVYEMSVIGAEPPRLLFRTGRAEYPASVSRDSRFLLYSLYSGFSKEGRGSDLWAYPLGGNHQVEPRPFLSRPLNQDQGQFSPDGRWVAYVSNESGPREVWVAPSSVDSALDGVRAGPGEQVSNGGGASPRWARSGKELFYLASDGTVMVVDVPTHGGVKPVRPSRLFRVPGALPDWGVSPDGNRFLFAVPVSAPPSLDVILNWDVGIRH